MNPLSLTKEEAAKRMAELESEIALCDVAIEGIKSQRDTSLAIIESSPEYVGLWVEADVVRKECIRISNRNSELFEAAKAKFLTDPIYAIWFKSASLTSIRPEVLAKIEAHMPLKRLGVEQLKDVVFNLIQLESVRMGRDEAGYVRLDAKHSELFSRMAAMTRDLRDLYGGHIKEASGRRDNLREELAILRNPNKVARVNVDKLAEEIFATEFMEDSK